jgi:hypothetical protein
MTKQEGLRDPRTARDRQCRRTLEAALCKYESRRLQKLLPPFGRRKPLFLSGSSLRIRRHSQAFLSTFGTGASIVVLATT